MKMHFRIRSNILPKVYADALVTAFVIVIIPIVYYYELFVVMPKFYEIWSFWYNFHFLMGTYILFNITSNYLAMLMIDTSTKGLMLPSTIEEGWHFCAICESTAPPRSWHCLKCNTCILKRDHHCMFSSCCIGHYNYRYFIIFVLYMFIATVYSSYYNIYFVWSFIDLQSWTTIVKLVFPLAMLFLHWTTNQCYLFLFLIVLLGGVLTGAILYFHCDLMLRGYVTHEKKKGKSPYDFGRKQNIKVALGERWYLVWVSPFINSKLSHDGINWDKKDFRKDTKDL